ncbi:response regulator transcription factor [Microbacteriaceae bacterium VKM Ac-2855]|nr:response regulator transcription factor [Microbacteriaceae bacterium VKM Ac-2855]
MSAPTQSIPDVSVIHPSRLEAESIALFMRREARGRPAVEVLHGDRPWREAAGRVVIVDRASERPSLLPMVVRELTERDAKVVLLVGASADPVAQAGRFAGAYAVVEEKAPLSALLDVVEHGLAGHLRRRDVFGEAWQSSLSSRGDGLTPRERSVVELMVSSEEPSIDEIATELGMSPHTVRVHLANVRKRLGGERAKNRVSLRRALEEHGWIDPL